ncbi:hypothetical protein QR680_017925 [Steinernema hermaphroditum]|uniref:Protein YIPF n=1 Tax=Steinernema hermaphroditum TaxID=289476 RepID=A0AA39HIE0_9BILA|nr:hypothetical protein QR680_017925 [Steinernema hermaphroditum]
MSQDFPSVHSSSPTPASSDPFAPAAAPVVNPANILIDLSTPPRSQAPAPASDEMSAHNFGNAAVDIEALEKEIAAKEQTRREKQYADLTGEIVGAPSAAYRKSTTVEPALDADFDTLDEPFWDSANRDLKTVSAKFFHVLIPKNNQQLLKDWDLWGPLFICVFLSLLLQTGSNSKGPHFTEVFMLVSFGSIAVTLNIKLLGGVISFFQAMCVLGYCLLAPLAAAIAIKALGFVIPAGNSFGIFIRLCLSTGGFIWATYASMNFLSNSQSEKRKILVTYPVFLFYFVVSWLIVSNL